MSQIYVGNEFISGYCYTIYLKILNCTQTWRTSELPYRLVIPARLKTSLSSLSVKTTPRATKKIYNKMPPVQHPFTYFILKYMNSRAKHTVHSLEGSI